MRPGLIERWNQLVADGLLEAYTSDKEARPYFVALQAIVEHVLAQELNHAVQSLVGVIHTPMPATPLCSEGSISEELVHPEIASDPQRLFTVSARTTILRDFLFKGGDLYAAYPKEGFLKRSEGQQAVYKKELEQNPAHLFDCPLECEEMNSDLTGAFYLFQENEDTVFGFGIKMTQANNPQEEGHFCLWFGNANQEAFETRLRTVMQFIQSHSPKPISLPIKF